MTYALSHRITGPLRRTCRILGALLPLCAIAWVTACNGSGSAIPVYPKLTSISVTPATLNVAAGVTDQLAATALYSDGSKQDVTLTATWTSSNAQAATISVSGLASALTPGSTTLTATLGGVSGSATLTVTAATLVAIGVTPAMPSLAAGSVEQFTATGVYTDNSKHDLTALVTWISSRPSVASISNSAASSGIATTLLAGSTSISATLNGISSPAVTLTVTPATLASIAVTPVTPSIAAGTTQQFVATGTYSDKSTQNLTSSVKWVSSTPAVAIFNNPTGTAGLATGLAPGNSSVTAALQGVVSPAVTLAVTPATLVSIAITPATASIAAGTVQQFTATGTFSDESTQDLTASVTWTSSNPTIASISNASGSIGRASSLQAGQADITAQIGGVISTPATLTVTPATLLSISITPATPSVMVGDTLQLTATGTYTDNSTQNLTAVATWTSSNTSVATISNASGSNGVVTPLVAGSTQITAASGSVISPSVTLGVILPSVSIVYSFTDAGSNGYQPVYSGVIQGSDGNFYGTTNEGGATGLGTVYKLTPSGVQTILYSFGRAPDAMNPNTSLLQASDGNFYGTARSGGANGAGAVFKVTPAGAESLLYSFSGGNDGANPVAALIQGDDGNFYGTTGYGGTSGQGTVFKLTPTGIETVLYSFAGSSDGRSPVGSLIQGSDGNFYGTTTLGGADGAGIVFMVTAAGAETVLYTFTGGSDGAYPGGGLILGIDGNFYGTTQSGGANNLGTVFKLTPAGIESVVYSFGGNGDGTVPFAPLLQTADGSLYGTTTEGGGNNSGTIFKITPAGVENLLYSFAGEPDGATPFSGMIQASDGNLYATTAYGGTSNVGTVYKLGIH